MLFIICYEWFNNNLKKVYGDRKRNSNDITIHR